MIGTHEVTAIFEGTEAIERAEVPQITEGTEILKSFNNSND